MQNKDIRCPGCGEEVEQGRMTVDDEGEMICETCEEKQADAKAALEAKDCNLCSGQHPDDYDQACTHCSICEGKDQWSKRKHEDHPCRFCRMITHSKHTCPCDTLLAWVEEYKPEDRKKG